jgi:hypothetical protein
MFFSNGLAAPCKKIREGLHDAGDGDDWCMRCQLQPVVLYFTAMARQIKSVSHLIWKVHGQ